MRSKARKVLVGLSCFGTTVFTHLSERLLPTVGVTYKVLYPRKVQKEKASPLYKSMSKKNREEIRENMPQIEGPNSKHVNNKIDCADGLKLHLERSRGFEGPTHKHTNKK